MPDHPEPTDIWLAGCKLPWWKRWLASLLCDEPWQRCPGFKICMRCGRTFDD